MKRAIGFFLVSVFLIYLGTVYVQVTCNPPCGNGGTCIAENVCSCPDNFSGDRCQLRLCTPPCENGGTCLEKNICSCSETFEGDRCEIDLNWKLAKSVGKIVLKTAVASGAVIGGAAIGLPALGFGAAGPIAGSLAATYQSTVLGGTVASGSVFATLQTFGMAGLSAAAKAGIVGASALLSAVTNGKVESKEDTSSEEGFAKWVPSWCQVPSWLIA